MTTQEYIASGILEMYATGGLPANERAQVEAMLQQHPEIREELNHIVETLESYAKMQAQTPPAALKTKILNSIHGSNLKAENINNSQTKTLTAQNSGVFRPKEIPFSQEAVPQNKPAAAFNWLTAAAVILFLISAGLNFYFYNNWKDSEGNLKLALNQQQEIAQNFKQAKFELAQTEKALHILEDLDTKHVVMKGLAKSPDSEAIIHWDPTSKMVLLEVKKLPTPATGRQYQLWALKNGKPTNAGLFNPGDTLMGIQHMNSIQDAEAFALTLEPVGGSENPTMEEMYTLGKM